MHVTSISQRILSLLQEPGLTAVVHSTFAEACNLTASDGTVFSLVSDKVGDGPLNAVVQPAQTLAVVSEGDTVSGDGRWLRLGPGWRLDLAPARPWDPRPDFRRLATWPRVVRTNLGWLRDSLPLEAPAASLAADHAVPTQGAFGSRPAMAVIQSHAAQLTNGLLQSYQRGSLPWITIFARRLAGLGPGLTPAGDDWMAGWLVGLRANEALGTGPGAGRPGVDQVGKAVLQGARDQTNPLSLAFLAAAADGAVGKAWHDLLDALPSADPVPIRYVAEEIMRTGATSGSDMLAGFLAAF